MELVLGLTQHAKEPFQASVPSLPHPQADMPPPHRAVNFQPLRVILASL